MTTTRVFKSGHSQAVRLPKEFRFNCSEVEIFRRGNEIVLRERPSTTEDVLALLNAFSDDFMNEGRGEAAPQEREPL